MYKKKCEESCSDGKCGKCKTCKPDCKDGSCKKPSKQKYNKDDKDDSYKKFKKACGGKKKFIVSLESKDYSPCCNRVVDSDYVYAIDGCKQKQLRLKRGEDYYFYFKKRAGESCNYNLAHNLLDVEQYQFFFTTDPLGGSCGILSDSASWKPCKLDGSPEPFGEGCWAKLKVRKDWPDVIYYQDRNHIGMGAAICLH